jgi:hypothetical protein
LPEQIARYPTRSQMSVPLAALFIGADPVMPRPILRTSTTSEPVLYRHREKTPMAVHNSLPSDEKTVPVELLLTDSALGIGRRLLPNRSWRNLATGLAERRDRVCDRLGGLGRELAQIVRGDSERAPAKADKRFADPAWQTNPLFRRAMWTPSAAPSCRWRTHRERTSSKADLMGSRPHANLRRRRTGVRFGAEGRDRVTARPVAAQGPRAGIGTR